jgi:hypothetical protein
VLARGAYCAKLVGIILGFIIESRSTGSFAETLLGLPLSSSNSEVQNQQLVTIFALFKMRFFFLEKRQPEMTFA